MILQAPAKINWFLIVRGLRDDGYHEIISLMQRISVYDELTFEPSDEIEVITEADIPAKENLVYRAANLMKDLQKGRTKTMGVRITLRKEIPIAAGLGGGSSDAATTIMALNKLWRLNLGVLELMKIGATIGSDVPFFFSAPAATVKGKGEIVHPVKLRHSYPLLLVKPPLKVQTGWAYSEISRVIKDNGTSLQERELACLEEEFISGLQAGNPALAGLRARNDLETIVIKRYPVIGEIKKRLTACGAIFSIMSGSGPTVIGIFDTHEKAKQAIKCLPEQYWCRVAETVI